MYIRTYDNYNTINYIHIMGSLVFFIFLNSTHHSRRENTRDEFVDCGAVNSVTIKAAAIHTTQHKCYTRALSYVYDNEVV